MINYQEKKLAVIGAGIAAKPIIDKAKKLGLKTYCFSTIKGATCKDECDVFYDVNIFDIEKIYSILQEVKIDGVIASAEITTEIAAILADKLGLPGNSIKDGFAARNKYIMRQRVLSLDTVYQPKFQMYEDGLVPDFPVIVKAPDSFGKKGISLAYDQESFKKAVMYSKKISDDVLIEEYIEGGVEYSVECLCNGQEVYVVQITEKETSGPPHFVELGHHQPANLSQNHWDAIAVATKDILNVLGINCGMAHLEIKLKDDKIYFIEVGARAGGDFIGDILVALSTDCDYYKGAIDIALGVFKPTEFKTVAHSGIYFLCEQTRKLLPLFKNARKFDWCYHLEINNENLQEIAGNGDDLISGKLIYCADKKVDVSSLNGEIVEIKYFENSIDLLVNFNKEVKIYSTVEEMIETSEKFLRLGNPIGIVVNNRLIAYFNIYCNNTETLEAYFGNLYVLDSYRRQGIAKRLVEYSFDFAKGKGFKKILLHVADDNYSAISLYEGVGFEYTGNTKQIADENTLEMVKVL